MEITVNEALNIWNEKFPDNQITRQTIHNWAKKFGWIKNDDRIIRGHKLVLDGSRFNDYMNSFTE